MSDRFQVRKKPFNYIRVVDREDNRVDGVWNQEHKTWFDVRGFIDAGND